MILLLVYPFSKRQGRGWHFRRIFANTSSPEMSSTSPRSIWETYRSASSAHKRSISARVGRLRLARSFSTKLIRASDGNESASLNTLSATTDIFHLPLPILNHRKRQGANHYRLIGIGGSFTAPLLPHHRTYGSRIRRFGGLGVFSQPARLGHPREWKQRRGDGLMCRAVGATFAKSFS